MSRQIERRSGTLGFLISLCVFLCAQPGVVSAQHPSDFDLQRLLERTGEVSHIRGELIVRFADAGAQVPTGPGFHGPLTRLAVRNLLSDEIVSGATVGDMYDSVVPGLTLVKLPAGKSVLDAVVQFNESPNVVYAEPNYKIKALLTPDDPRFMEQWGLDNTGQTGGLPNADVNAPEAWDVITDVPNIVVAITDTGIDYNHPDLVDNIWINDGEVNEPGVVGPNDVNDTDDDGNGYNDDFYGYDFVDDDPDPMDEHYHGTHVAGIVGATGNNTTGVAGVCWSVKLMALRTLDPNGEGDTADAIAAIGYAVDMGANIINASWGSYQYQQSLYDAVEAAGEAGVILVAAAGNDSVPMAMYPAGFSGIGGLDNVISVLATTHFDTRAFFSNYSAFEIDLGAPGDAILSTTPTASTDAMDDDGVGTDYDLLSGTSQAAPFVSGACALMQGISSQWTPDQTRQIIMRTVDPVLPGECVSGGRLNLYRTVVAARGGAVVNRRTGIRYPTIQEAIDDALDGDYLVADANNWYFEKIDFIGKKISLRSGDVNDTDLPDFLGVPSPRTTYISGLFDGGPVVTFANGEDSQTRISGFSIVDSNMEGVHFEASSPDFNECIVSRNQGNGIYCLASSPLITACTISQNTASGDGGGIYLQSGSSPNIVDTTILGNTAGMNGGGIFCVAESDPNIIGGGVRGNSARHGGGIYCDDTSDPNIMGSPITGNRATGNGGGIYCLSQMIANGVTLLGNNASGWGGGMYCSDGAAPDIIDCMITGNWALWQGGGIYSAGSSPDILDCEITTNRTAWDGGGMYFDGGQPNVINSTITGNVADYDGGAIYCNASPALIRNCLIVDNSVESWDGGAMFCLDASPVILNCTFVRNSANNFDGVGSGVYCAGSSEPSITNCIFSNNNHVAIYERDSQSDAEVAFCLFYANRGGDYYDFDTDNTYDANSSDPNGQDPNNLNFIPDGMAGDNINGDPMFVPGRLGEFYLSQFEAGQILDANGEIVDPNVNPQDATSPAVDAGSTDANSLGMSVYSTRTDNYEDPNTGEKDFGTVDIGYHYDDPQAPRVYMLTTMAVPGGTGLISPASGGSYVQYAHVALEASPADPNVYQFKVWTGTDDDTRIDLTPTGGIATVQINIVTMDGAKTVVAEFETILVTLRTRVVAGNGTVRPRGGMYRRGTVVDLKATPADPAQVIGWTGTDNDYSIVRDNTVTMSPPFMIDPQGREFKEVEVVFYTPRTVHVPDDYTSIQYAIDDANNGDIIVIAPADEPYLTVQGFYIYKTITITGSNPDDPSTVGRTIIEMQPQGPAGDNGQAFLFWGVGPDTLLNGLTIRGFNLQGANGQGGNPNQGYYDGVPGVSVYGSGILCFEASPTIKNCVITDCAAIGGDGGGG
ncbi:MAG: S8 family serine peptidase, partial [Phycisphaerales bacterium]